MGGFSYVNEAAKIVSHSVAGFIAPNFHKHEPKELLRKASDMANDLEAV